VFKDILAGRPPITIMMDNRRCIVPTGPTSDLLTFLCDFMNKVETAGNIDRIHHYILETFSDISSSSSTALWTFEVEHGGYRLRGRLGSCCRTIPNMLPASFGLPNALPAVPCFIARNTAPHLFAPDVEAILEDLFSVSCSNAVTFLTYEGGTVGFCTFQLETRAGLHDPTAESIFRLAAQISAGVLHRSLAKDNLRHSHTLLRRTDRLRSLEIMAGGFAHEIRNPLTSIKTFVQLAPERRDDARFIQEFSRVAVQDIHRIEHLLQEILDYARYLVPTPTEENLNELVASCLSFISMRASGRGIQVRTDFSDHLPVMLLDRQQIKQVIINLLLNALDASRDQSKEIVVRTFIEQRSNAVGCVCIEVQDDGKGIAPQDKEHIFDPFFTTHHSNSGGEVKGLGLTIAHQIIREHQGDITVESREGFGSTFRVSLPIDARQHSSDGTGVI
jgi:signal transduction histidine kinase